MRKFTWSAVALAMLATVGCEMDYWFLAFLLEGDYPDGEWTEVICIEFESSPFEFDGRDIDMELDFDPPEGITGAFPKKLQIELVAYDADGAHLWSYRTKKLKVDAGTGRIETLLPFAMAYVVPQGGRLCPRIKPFKTGLMEGYKAGILLEPVAE